MNIDDARNLLNAADVFFGIDPEEGQPEMAQSLNLSDTWGWACADCEYVPDDDLPDVAALFSRYGWGGILHWVSVRRDGQRSEFHDINRHIDFVRAEEQIRHDEPNDSKRAYLKRQYTIGEIG